MQEVRLEVADLVLDAVSGQVSRAGVPLPLTRTQFALLEYFMRRAGSVLSREAILAIESLPEHYREVVLLRNVEELTINEIASRLGRTREAVKGIFIVPGCCCGNISTPNQLLVGKVF